MDSTIPRPERDDVLSGEMIDEELLTRSSPSRLALKAVLRLFTNGA